MPHTQKRFHPRTLPSTYAYLDHLRQPKTRSATARREEQFAASIGRALAQERMFSNIADTATAAHHRHAAGELLQQCRRSRCTNGRVLELICTTYELTPEQTRRLLDQLGNQKQPSKKRKRKK